MTVASTTTAMDHGSDAQFRTWGSAVSALFSAAGLTNTSDTGQINWSTVARAGTNADAGYEIWRWNDTAHSTRPMFFKVRYGTGAATDRGRVRIDIGEGSNGSGTLTGAVKTDFLQWHMRNNTTGYCTFAICYNTTVGYFGTRFGVPAGGSPSYNTQMMSIERLRNTDGTPSTRGFAVWKPSDPDTDAAQYWTLTAGAWSTDTSGWAPMFWPGNADGFGTTAGAVIAPLMPFTGYSTHGPVEKTLGCLFVGFSDFSGGNVFTTARWDGNTYTYLVGDDRGGTNSATSSYKTRTAILWQ